MIEEHFFRNQPLELLEPQNSNDECLSGITVDSEKEFPKYLSIRKNLSNGVRLLEPENSDQETSTIAKEPEATLEQLASLEPVSSLEQLASLEPEQLLSDYISEPIELTTNNVSL